jgi:hypothetical protein
MKKTFSALFILLLGSALCAQQRLVDYSSFLTAAERDELVTKGELGSIGTKLEDLSLWRRAPFSPNVLAELSGRPSTIAAECLFLLDRPRAASEAELNRAILKSFTSFSTMKGLLVYSDSLKKMETFIFDSYRVASLEDRRALPDPDPKDLSASLNYALYQKEEQAGAVYSRMSVHASGESTVVTLSNLTELRLFGLRFVGPGNLCTLFIVVPLDDRLVLYGATLANTPHLFGLERMKQKSFFYRMKALASWFETNLEKQTN